MGNNILDLTLDVIFKKFFIDNQNLLKRFLADVFNKDISSIGNMDILNTELIPQGSDGKFSRLDLLVSVDDVLTDIEIQIYKDPTYRDRSLYYWSKIFTSSLKRGEPYSKLKPSVVINIVNFEVVKGTDYHSTVSAIINETGEVFSDKLSIHFFDLKKAGSIMDSARKVDGKEEIAKIDNLKVWMNLFNAKTEEELGMLKKLDNFTDVVDAVYRISNDDAAKKLAEDRSTALSEERSRVEAAREEGFKEGREEGRKAGREESRKETEKILRKYYAGEGMSEEEIDKIIYCINHGSDSM